MLTKTLIYLTTLIMILLGILDLVGVAVSSIWLALIGQWWALGAGLVGICVHFLLFSILWQFIFWLSQRTRVLYFQGKFVLAAIMAGVTLLCISTLFAAWGIASLYFFVSRATENSLIPLLIWSYCIAVMSWVVFFGNFGTPRFIDANSNTIGLTMFFYRLGYLIGIVFFFLMGSLEAVAHVLVIALAAHWISEMFWNRHKFIFDVALHSMVWELWRR